jgi:putative Ca2+/H+ antiporter (TMEM165/GDT1 family)
MVCLQAQPVLGVEVDARLRGWVVGGHGAYRGTTPSRDLFVHAFLLSFGIIFVAELGDKSQLMALTFAARFKASTILISIALATGLVHLVSVLVGAALGVALPTKAIAVIGGVAFLGFAAWTLRGDTLDDDEEARAEKSTRSVFWTVGIAFFVAELGDKTMLATITLATDHGLFGTWLGSTLGMVAADALAIVVGQQLGARLPEKVIKIGASVLFVVFGVWLIVEGLR